MLTKERMKFKKVIVDNHNGEIIVVSDDNIIYKETKIGDLYTYEKMTDEQALQYSVVQEGKDAPEHSRRLSKKQRKM